jgi:hypothetical protein
MISIARVAFIFCFLVSAILLVPLLEGVVASGVRFSMVPSFTHVIVSPTMTPEFKLEFENSGDPGYFSFEVKSEDGYLAGLFFDDNRIATDSPKLFKTGDKQKLKLILKPQSNNLMLRDYQVLVYAKNVDIFAKAIGKKIVVLEPQIMSRYILSVTNDGSYIPKNKIALFQNSSGHVSSNLSEQKLVMVVQNMAAYGNYVRGTVRIVGPAGFSKTYSIPEQYVAANSQRSILTGDQLDTSQDNLLTLPPNVPAGKYVASAELRFRGANVPLMYGQTSFVLISPSLLWLGAFALVFIISSIVFFTARSLFSSR